MRLILFLKYLLGRTNGTYLPMLALYIEMIAFHFKTQRNMRLFFKLHGMERWIATYLPICLVDAQTEQFVVKINSARTTRVEKV